MVKGILLSVSLFWAVVTFGQARKLTEKDFAQKPYWIQMMDQESVNFNEALRAFEVYWQNHKFPEEEGDRYIQRNPVVKPLSKKEYKAIREGDEMRFQIKRFKHWIIINENFVKENGFTMTAEERLRLYNQNR